MLSQNNIVWIDLEMTGLNPARDCIIEIATIVTDNQLNIIAEGPSLAIYQEQKIINSMDQWNKHQHRISGLIDKVCSSTFNELDAEQLTLEFLEQYVLPGQSPMCGNSICQDRRFLARFMPRLEYFFHYRNLDVSTIKELAIRWYGVQAAYKKVSYHTAMQDIYSSIEELKFYRSSIFLNYD